MTLLRQKILLIALVCIALAAGVLAFIFINKTKNNTSAVKTTYSYTTTSGKKIAVALSENSTSSVAIITTEGFQINQPITISKDKLSNVYFSDLNGDTFEEVILTFAPALESGTGDMAAFTTYYDTELTAVELPSITEEDVLPGRLFEGYKGGDSFVVQENTLFRTFLAELVTSEEVALPEEIPEEGEEQTNENEEIVSEGEETPIATNIQLTKKQVSYNLVSSEGIFFLEPRPADEVTTIIASSTISLENTSWRWLSLNYKNTISTAPEADPLVFSFFPEATFSASSSCEKFTGNYILNGYLIRLGSIASAQPENEVSTCKTSNDSLKEALTLGESLLVTENQMIVNLSENKGVILFTKE